MQLKWQGGIFIKQAINNCAVLPLAATFFSIIISHLKGLFGEGLRIPFWWLLFLKNHPLKNISNYKNKSAIKFILIIIETTFFKIEMH